MIYTIKIDDSAQSSKLNQFLENFVGIQYSVIKDIPKNPASVSSLKDFQNRIEQSRKSVRDGLFLSDDEFEKESSKW